MSCTHVPNPLNGVFNIFQLSSFQRRLWINAVLFPFTGIAEGYCRWRPSLCHSVGTKESWHGWWLSNMAKAEKKICIFCPCFWPSDQGGITRYDTSRTERRYFALSWGPSVWHMAQWSAHGHLSKHCRDMTETRISWRHWETLRLLPAPARLEMRHNDKIA
jgi:hypothetical protein